MSGMQRGVVKWFNDAKGFGFIEHETGRDVFVHYSVIEAEGFKTLKDGEIVDYELKEGDKGLHAARVLRTNPPAPSKKIKKGFGSAHALEGEGDAEDGSDAEIELSAAQSDGDLAEKDASIS